MGQEKISSVLFVCTMNAVRSPMAAALLAGDKRLYVESAGVQAGAPDPMAVAVMAEIGVTLSHRPRCFEDVEDGSFDLVVALSPEAEIRARQWSRTAATRIEYWPTPDPTQSEGTAEQRKAAYRAVRDGLKRQIAVRFA